MLVGAMPASGAAPSRGDQSSFGGDYGPYGYEFGYEFGADAPLAIAPPQNQAELHQAWKTVQGAKMETARRVRMLEPNKGSLVKVERYTFSLNQSLILGTLANLAATNQPDVNIRPQRVTTNAPQPGFATLTEVKVANVSVTVGGIADAFQFNANAVGQELDLPTLSPSNRASMIGQYTGFTPPGFVGGNPFTFAVSFTGPSSVMG